MFIIKNGKVFTGLEDHWQELYIVIEGTKIKAVEPDLNTAAYLDAEIIDVTGSYVLPGLIDCHVHILNSGAADDTRERMEPDAYKTLKGAAHARKMLTCGFTTVRNMGSEHCLDVSLSRAIDEGLIEGCRIIPSGEFITMTGGHGWSMGRQVDGPWEAKKAAREQLRAGAKVIKIMATGGVMTPGVEPGSPQLTLEEIRAAVEEAHKAGCKTASHAQGTAGIKNAILAGIDSIEHGIYLDEETVDLMLKYNVALVPTLVAPYHIVRGGIEAGIPAFAVDKAKRVQERHLKSFELALRAGIKIGMGTDAGTPLNRHGNNALELQLMVEAGMSPLQALLAATRNAAEIIGRDDLGTIEVGKTADLIIVDSDPLQDICVLKRKPNAVIKGGSIIQE